MPKFVVVHGRIKSSALEGKYASEGDEVELPAAVAESLGDAVVPVEVLAELAAEVAAKPKRGKKAPAPEAPPEGQ